jgi:hypothetical protein
VSAEGGGGADATGAADSSSRDAGWEREGGGAARSGALVFDVAEEAEGLCPSRARHFVVMIAAAVMSFCVCVCV